MAWSTPPTFSTGELVPASKMTQLSDNLAYLLSRPGSTVLRDNGANYTTTSTSFVDVDATNLKVIIALSGAVALVGFVGESKVADSNCSLCFDIDVDGTRYANAGTNGLTASHLGVTGAPFFSNTSFVIRVPSLATGSHTFKLKWRVSSATTGTLCAGNGVSTEDLLPSIWAQEVA